MGLISKGSYDSKCNVFVSCNDRSLVCKLYAGFGSTGFQRVLPGMV